VLPPYVVRIEMQQQATTAPNGEGVPWCDPLFLLDNPFF
jgi:hypothetical protein